MEKRSDFLGLEFDWFAVDSDGCVALLSSSGYGPIPDPVFERFEGQARIEDFLSGLIDTNTSSDLLRVAKLLASAGIFAYDWKHWEGPYERFAAPEHPRRWDAFGFPEALRDAFASVPISFGTHTEFRPELWLPCTE